LRAAAERVIVSQTEGGVMGTWDTGAFDNDTACDWGWDLEESTDLSLLAATVQSADRSDEVPASDACRVLAACEVIARLKGNWGVRNPYTARVDRWVERIRVRPSTELTSQAVSAIDRILRPPSELLELWVGSAKESAWHEGVLELRTRVAG
jgi:hypothetical protein